MYAKRERERECLPVEWRKKSVVFTAAKRRLLAFGNKAIPLWKNSWVLRSGTAEQN